MVVYPESLFGRLHTFGHGREDQTLRGEGDFSLTALHKAIDSILTILSKNDAATIVHHRRVAALARSIGDMLRLSPLRRQHLSLAALVHDIGKFSMPREILDKPGPLTEEEWKMIESHPKAGFDILCFAEFPPIIGEIVLQHHERLDGSGYPRGLAGEALLVEARIIAVADVFDALVSPRPYRASLDEDVALAFITERSGTLFDPAVVRAASRVVERVT